MSVVGSSPVCLPVIQLVKEALLNRCTVPGYYGAIHACNGRNSQVLSSALACTYQFTTGNDKGILLGKHSFPLSNLVPRFFFFQCLDYSSEDAKLLSNRASVFRQAQPSRLRYVLCLSCMYATYIECKVK